MPDAFFMRLAIDAAWKYQGVTYPNPAVGAVVVSKDNAILSIAAHQRAGGAHAEVLALKEAYKLLTGDLAIDHCENSHDIHHYLHVNAAAVFHGCQIFTTLEPCIHDGKTPSCAHLLKALSLERVVIGSLDTHAVAAGGANYLDNVSIGVCKEACEALLIPFRAWQKDRFVLFKWAQRLDGTVEGGTISSHSSRRNVHAMRDVCDLLVIGGNTVREDRPTLDSRLVDGAAPDVLIYSRNKVFDESIALFGVRGRKVFIEDNFERLKAYHNIFIEGGPSLFSATRSLVDCYLSFTAPSTGGTIPFTKECADFEFLHVEQIGSDVKMWLRKKHE